MDNWEGRKMHMRCISCIFYVPKKPEVSLTGSSKGKVKPPNIVGRCKRHAPTMNGFPVVFESDWCGDHKLDENSII